MADGNSAKSDTEFHRDVTDFKKAFEQDIDDRFELFKFKMLQMLSEREILLTEFLNVKNDAVAAIGNTFDDLENMWIDMLSKIKDSFLNSMKLLFEEPTLKVKCPEVKPTELNKLDEVPVTGSKKDNKDIQLDELSANQKAMRQSEQLKSEMDLETTSQTPTQDNNSSSEYIEIRHAEIAIGNLFSSNKELNAEDAGTSADKVVSGTGTESPSSVDEILEALDASLGKWGSVWAAAVHKGIDTYRRRISSAFDEDEKDIILDEFLANDSKEDNKDIELYAIPVFSSTEDNKDIKLEEVSETGSTEDNKGIKLDEVPATGSKEDQKNRSESVSCTNPEGILKTSDQRKNLLELADTEPLNVAVVGNNEPSLNEREPHPPNTSKRKTYDDRDGAVRASLRNTLKKAKIDQRKPNGLQTLTQDQSSLSQSIEMRNEEISKGNLVSSEKSTNDAGMSNSKYVSESGKESTSSDDEILETLHAVMRITVHKGIFSYSKGGSNAFKEELEEVPATENTKDMTNRLSSALFTSPKEILENSDERHNLVELADPETPKAAVAEKSPSPLSERELHPPNTRQIKTFDERADGALRVSLRIKSKTVKTEQRKSNRIKQNERERKAKTHGSKDCGLRNKSVVQKTKQKIMLLNFLKSSASKNAKRKKLMDNVGDIRCSALNQEILKEEISGEYLKSVIEWAKALLSNKEIALFLQQVCVHVGCWHKTNFLQALLEKQYKTRPTFLLLSRNPSLRFWAITTKRMTSGIAGGGVFPVMAAERGSHHLEQSR